MTVSDYTLLQFNIAMKPVWDDVVTSSRNGNFLHLRSYIDYHTHRFDERSVIVFKDGKPVAVFPCNCFENKIISHGGLTYAGLIYGNQIRTAEILQIFEVLIEYYRQQGCSSLLYKAIPHIFQRYPAEEDLYALHRLGARLVRRDLSSVIQMANRIKLSDSRKNTIKKASKSALVVRETFFFESFHTLLTGTLTKHGVQPVHSVAELLLLQSKLPDKIRLFGAFSGEEMLAGALIFDFGHVAHSQYLASSVRGKTIGALDFLLAHLLSDFFNDCQFFSFGISTEQQGRYLNEGLVFQKEGFGGRAIVHDFYQLEI